jgi:predicted flap endonuclease-1-like 5' DNA nuclease
MDLKKLTEAIDTQVVAGNITAAFEQFAAENCITHSNPQDITHSKGQKTEALRWFFSNIERINGIQRHAVAFVNENEAKSQFTFDFTNKQGHALVYNEVIRRVWSNGQLVEEQYLFNETIAPAKASKKAKADVVAAPAPAKATEKKAAEKKPAAKAEAPKAAAPAVKAAPATKTTEKKAVAPKKATAKTEAPKAAAPAKTDDLTIVEGIGPKIAELLQNAGIKTFADLAKAKPAAIKSILEAAGKRYQMHDPATWPKQATLARDGKQAELAKLQNELKGGK